MLGKISLLSVISSVAVAGPFYRPISFDYVNEVVNGQTVTQWTPARMTKLNNAMNVIADRMLDPSITECALSNARQEFHTGSPFTIQGWQAFRNLVFMQRNALFNKGFPKVKVRILTNLGSGAQAQVGNFVDARSTSSGYSVTGIYNVDVKASVVDANNISADNLGALLAHEMLHQMTHSHDTGPGAYLDHNFVVAYQMCLQFNGVYYPFSAAYGLTEGAIPMCGI